MQVVFKKLQIVMNSLEVLVTGRKQVAVGDPLTEGAGAWATNVHSVGNLYSCRVFR